MKEYIIWVDYGSEGWAPHDFGTEEEAIQYVLKGQTYGSGHVMTRLLEIKAHLAEVSKHD